MKKPRVLVESSSPVCSVQAFAEESETCVYFYLWFSPDSECARVKPCWVCNTCPAPEGMDQEAMERGEAPRMPRKNCLHDPRGIRLDPHALSIVWLEEGDGAALLENGRILALIPGWAGESFPGYARHASGTTPFAWALEEAEAVLSRRVAQSQAYWETMEGGYWPAFQEAGLCALENFFGKYEKYYAIDGGNFPTKALVTGRRGGVRYGLTLGMGALCQPVAEQYFQDGGAALHRRIELAFAAGEDLPEAGWMGMLNYLSGQSSLPWSAVSWLGHGHTIPCRAAGMESFPAVVLVDPRELSGIPSPAYPAFLGGPVPPRWAVPVTPEEYDDARESGSPALLARYQGPPDRLTVFDGKPKFRR